MTNLIKLLATAATAATLAGCVTPYSGSDGLYAKPIGGAPVTANPTPYSAGLVCMADYARYTGIQAPRIAVGRVLDYTGKADYEGGRQVTQGASLMAISAFAKAGARLVERFDTSVSELELKYANNKLIGADAPTGGEFRQIYAGSIPGSDYYLVGGITELNSNIRSLGAEAYVGDLDADDAKGRAGAKLFVVNVGLDLRLVDTKTLEVVDVISYQKQIIGREISAGIFDFANNNVFDIGVGERALEPMQLAVRSVIERAVLEMVANLYGVPGSESCEQLNQAGAARGTQSVVGDYQPVAGVSSIDGDRRADVTAWSSVRDPSMRSALRGRSKTD
ncbi:MAG: holdfast anchoring protein HfaB [Hyphomonadaceae bacterium]